MRSIRETAALSAGFSGPVDEAFDRWYTAQRHQLTNEQVCRLIWRRAWDAAAAQYGAAYRREETRADKAEAALDEALEAAEILDNLMDSVRKHGNYSQEATLLFLSHARQCLNGLPQNDQAKARLDPNHPA